MASVPRVTIEDLFEIVPGRSQGDEVTIICPEPGCGDKSGNRSINIQSGKTSCWRCNKGGDFYFWARSLGHDVTPGKFEAIASKKLVREELERLDAPRKKVRSAYVSELALPKGFTRIADDPDCAYAKLIGHMAERKNLTLKIFSKAGVGFTRDDPLWEPYAIFPVTEHGRVVYFQGRTYTDEEGKPTKRFPSKDQVPNGSRNWLYNIDEVRERGKIVICVESILNVMSLKRELAARGIDDGIVPVAVFKHKLSDEQIEKLRRCRHLTEVNVMFDPLMKAEAWKEGARLCNHFKVTISEMPLPLPGKKEEDPNHNPKAAIDAFLVRKKYSAMNALLART